MKKSKNISLVGLSFLAILILGLGIIFGIPNVAKAEGETPSVIENSAGANVASVTTGDGTVTEYPDITAAISVAKEGETVTLLDNVTESITVDVGKSVKLVLNGHTITGTVTDSAPKIPVIKNQGTLVIEGSGRVVGADDYYVIVNEGTLTLNTGITVTKEVTQEVKGSSLILNGQDGAPTIEKALLTINGGTFSGGLNNIKNTNAGELIVEDG